MSRPARAPAAGGGGDGPGTIAEEAALLAAALSDWIAAHAGGESPRHGRDTGADHSPRDAAGDEAPDAPDSGAAAGSGESAAGHSSAGHSSAGHSAAGHPSGEHPWTCSVCPLCRLLASLTGNRPDLAAHLLDAVVSLAAAARDVWAAWSAMGGWSGADGSGPDGAAAGRNGADRSGAGWLGAGLPGMFGMFGGPGHGPGRTAATTAAAGPEPAGPEPAGPEPADRSSAKRRGAPTAAPSAHGARSNPVASAAQSRPRVQRIEVR